MSDRELLELAAKAAGLRMHDGTHAWMEGPSQWVRWNPLTDDGDALRLAVQLRLNVSVFDDAMGNEAEAWSYSDGVSVDIRVKFDTDPYAATRLAITRAAAEIGRSKT